MRTWLILSPIQLIYRLKCDGYSVKTRSYRFLKMRRTIGAQIICEQKSLIPIQRICYCHISDGLNPSWGRFHKLFCAQHQSFAPYAELLCHKKASQKLGVVLTTLIWERLRVKGEDPEGDWLNYGMWGDFTLNKSRVHITECHWSLPNSHVCISWIWKNIPIHMTLPDNQKWP